MKHPEFQYLDLLSDIINNWTDRWDRTWTWTRSIFGAQMRFSMKDWFPLLTTKKMFTRGIIHELVWFVRWETNIKYLADNDVHIWDDWPYKNYKDYCISQWYNESEILSQKEFIEKIKSLDKEDEFVQKWGDLWPVYWQQWRNFNQDWFDQLQNAVDMIKNNPESRRIIVNAWNPLQVDNMLLPPCHMIFQFYVASNKLSLHMYQRSADMFLWVPFNIASYSMLLYAIANITWLEAGDFVHTIWDAHIYHNHFDQVKEQLSREPFDFPSLKIKEWLKSLDDLEFNDFSIENYKSHPAIKAPIAV